ncbi:diguanylate cyclase [bacterium 3DAC]|nr:diguanylate cyclase [bacterium 3DAC]
MLKHNMLSEIVDAMVPYIEPDIVEESVKTILEKNGYMLKHALHDDGLVFPSGIYHIYYEDERQYDWEHVISKLFSIYGMSHELYDDLAAKLTVLRTLTHTLSVLAAASTDREGIKKVIDVITSETQLTDLILAVYDEKVHRIYAPDYVSEEKLNDIVERSIYKPFTKERLNGHYVYPHTYTTDNGIFFIGFLAEKDIHVRVEPELLALLLYILIPFLRSVYLSEIAFYDALTNVLTRGKLMESLSMLWDLSKYTDSSVGVLMCDIDHFKHVNDTYGHDVGDIVLKEIALRIKKAAPKGAIIGRYGGEEFVVAFHAGSREQVRKYAEAIRLFVAEQPVNYYGGSLHITISIGGTLGSPQSGESVTEALKRADNNLYKAKEDGRNRVFVK